MRAFLDNSSLPFTDFVLNHEDVLLFENRMSPSKESVVALGFSQRKQSSLAKSRLLTTLELGTHAVSRRNSSLGESNTISGRWSSNKWLTKTVSELNTTCKSLVQLSLDLKVLKAILRLNQ